MVSKALGAFSTPTGYTCTFAFLIPPFFKDKAPVLHKIHIFVYQRQLQTKMSSYITVS